MVISNEVMKSKYNYLSTIVSFLYFTWVFPFNATLYFYSTTGQREILYFLLPLHSLHNVSYLTI